MKRAGLLVALALHSLPSAAGDVRPWPVAVVGLGADSCASYVLALEDDRPSTAVTFGAKTYLTMANAYMQWASGFITAANWGGISGGREVSPVHFDGIAIWIKNYCEANPTHALALGAAAYAQAHQVKVRRPQ